MATRVDVRLYAGIVTLRANGVAIVSISADGFLTQCLSVSPGMGFPVDGLGRVPVRCVGGERWDEESLALQRHSERRRRVNIRLRSRTERVEVVAEVDGTGIRTSLFSPSSVSSSRIQYVLMSLGTGGVRLFAGLGAELGFQRTEHGYLAKRLSEQDIDAAIPF